MVFRWRKLMTSPCRSSSRIASRTEARLTLSSLAMAISLIGEPGSRRPSQIASSRVSCTDWRWVK